MYVYFIFLGGAFVFGLSLSAPLLIYSQQLSSAAGVHSNSPLEVCTINNKLSLSIQHRDVLHLDACLAKVMTSAHTGSGIGGGKIKRCTQTKMSIMSSILWESFTCVLKMNWVLVFPRLLRFQKWLGFMMFDVNSCSNWACKLGTVPRLAKWTQMAASRLNQKIAGKVASLWEPNWKSQYTPTPTSIRSSDLDLLF